MGTAAQESALTIVRKLKTTPRAIWRALTDPHALKQWMAPGNDFQVLVAETDVRVGGGYHFVIEAPDGQQYDVSGVYREIVPNEKLVYTWAWSSAPERESLVTFELTPAGDATELLLRHERFADKHARDRHEQGWTGSIKRLVRMFA